jgi:hypothetical protein
MRTDTCLLLCAALTIAGCDQGRGGASQQGRATDASAVAAVRLTRLTADQWSIGVADGWKPTRTGGWVYLESPSGAMLGIQRVEADSGPVTDESLRAFMQKGDARRQLAPIRLGPFTGYTLKSQDGVSVMRFWMVHAQETILSIVYEGAAGDALADRPAMEAMLGSFEHLPAARNDAGGPANR